MDLNPYAQHLGDNDPMEIIATTADRLGRLTSGLGTEVCNRPPAPGKWSVREIMAHLADCEIVFGFRLRQTLSQVSSHPAPATQPPLLQTPVSQPPVLQPFDQGVWAERYSAYDLSSALTLFPAIRAWNVKLIAGTTPAERKLPVLHPERGTMTFWTIVETMAGHDVNHLNQMERLALGRS